MAEFYLPEGIFGLKKVSITDAFPFLGEKDHVISIVGAGGKTSLMFAMAEMLCRQGQRVLVTTSTHIGRPDEAVMADTMEAVETLWQRGSYAVIGRAVSEDKLAMPEEKLLYPAISRADSVLIEADGARRLPCKAPGDKEPVILPGCDIVVGVLGLDALDQPIERICFRPERVAEVCGRFWKRTLTVEDRLTEQELTALLASEEGLRKAVNERTYYGVLNKCDNEKLQQRADTIVRELLKHGVKRIVVTRMK